MADMIAIIPAKWNSTRVPMKNYREFYAGHSLVDLQISKLLQAGIPAERIFLSCDNADAGETADKRGVRFVLRSERLCDNSVPLTDFVRGIVGEVDSFNRAEVGPHSPMATADVLWSQCCDPLFDDHRDFLRAWRENRDGHDSACVVYPKRGYLLGPDRRPMGWGFGPWHVPSQQLPTHYEFGFTASILTRESIRNVGYHIGARPLWYEAKNPTVDIDTEADFRFASHLYATQLLHSKF